MSSPEFLVALAGSPNCGKTALFNALTGTHQKVANYAGVTVEKIEGWVEGKLGEKFRILDLPGTYSLTPQSPDEEITARILKNEFESEQPHGVIAVADATNLEKSLSLVLELKEVGKPVILALNMMDLAEKRGLRLDLDKLSRELGFPVVPTVAVKKEGVGELIEQVAQIMKGNFKSDFQKKAITSSHFQTTERFHKVDALLKDATLVPVKPDILSEKIDRVVLHPVWGTLILFSVLALMFQAIFAWAAPFQDAIEAGFQGLQAQLANWLPAGSFRDLLIDGVIAGVGSVVVFLPQILFLFFFILLLEDWGYLARAAFLMDRLMAKAGLHGRAFIPLLSSVACAIPGIMATRTIENKRDRLTTIMVAPLMTCSARLPVYTLLISAFIPQKTVLGFFQLQGLVMFGLYLAGVVSAIGVAWFLKRTLLKGARPPLLLELPGYKIPALQNILMGLRMRSGLFLKKAGTYILAVSVLIWFLASFPRQHMPGAEGSNPPPIAESYAGKLGSFIEPVLRPIGFDWKISVALIPGFAAREVMVGALGTVYAIDGKDAHGAEDEEKLQSSLSEKIQAGWTLATALSLLAWYIFAPQCLSTMAVVRRETASWGWTSFMLIYLTGMAYVASFVVFHATQWLGVS